jgi:hypothetical protein
MNTGIVPDAKMAELRELEFALVQARETNRRLNRRAQKAESNEAQHLRNRIQDLEGQLNWHTYTRKRAREEVAKRTGKEHLEDADAFIAKFGAMAGQVIYEIFKERDAATAECARLACTIAERDARIKQLEMQLKVALSVIARQVTCPKCGHVVDEGSQ